MLSKLDYKLNRHAIYSNTTITANKQSTVQHQHEKPVNHFLLGHQLNIIFVFRTPVKNNLIVHCWVNLEHIILFTNFLYSVYMFNIILSYILKSLLRLKYLNLFNIPIYFISNKTPIKFESKLFYNLILI